MQVPDVTIATVELALAVQTPGVVEVKVTARPVEPPVTAGAKAASPTVFVAGPVIERVAWVALLIVTSNGAEVVGS